MRSAPERRQDYLGRHAAQLPVLTKVGQDKLCQARVHISGAGRIGTWVSIQLAAVGVGYESANDPQVVEQDNLGSLFFAGAPDIGKQKVFVLEKFYHGRPQFIFEPLITPTESGAIDPYIQRCDLVISCANTVEGRLAAERKAIKFRKPIMQVAALDGRERLGGLIALRLPANRWSACFGCYLANGRKFPRGEGLLSSVTATLAALASNMAVQLITGVRSDFIRQHNLFCIDMDRYQIDPLAVERRKDCKICGAT